MRHPSVPPVVTSAILTASSDLVMPNDSKEPSAGDPYFRRMMKWVFIALFVVLAVALLVVEVTLRMFGQ